MAWRGGRRVRRLAARVVAVIRIDAVWLAVEPVDMRAGADGLLVLALVAALLAVLVLAEQLRSAR